jgi:uncharacterized membrane protein
MKKISGLALIIIGLLHSAIALLIPAAIGFGGIWQEIAEVGVFDAAKPESLRIWGYYWFVISGLFTMLYGLLCYWIENQLNLPLPPFVGWGLLTIACCGIVLDLDSGFWLILLVAINAIVASQRKVRSLFPLQLFALLGCGLVAGVFLAFSSFVMKALARLKPSEGIAAMQSINITVINPLFMTALFGTAVICLFLVILSLLEFHDPTSIYLLVASLLYIFGTVGVTIAFNVPLNDTLAKVTPNSTEGMEI